jgi:hypothetical protein
MGWHEKGKTWAPQVVSSKGTTTKTACNLKPSLPRLFILNRPEKTAMSKSNHSSAGLIIVALLAAAGGWFGGSRVRRDHMQSVSSTAPVAEIPAAAVAADNSMDGNGRPSGTKVAGALGKRLRAALIDHDSLRGQADYFQALTLTTADNVEELRAVWSELLGSGKAFKDLEPITLQTFGRAEGTVALERLLREFGPGWQSWMAPVFDGVISKDPAAARAWFDSHPDEKWREAAVTPYLCAMARQRPQDIAGMLNGLDSEFTNRAAGPVASALCGSEGAAGAGLWLQQNMPAAGEAPKPWLQQAYDTIISQVALTPAGAGTAATMLEEGRGNPCFNPQTAAYVAGRYAWSGAVNALNWADRLHAARGDSLPTLRAELTASIISQTNDQDAEASSAWCAQKLSGAERQQAREALLNKFGPNSPDFEAKLNLIFGAP